MRILFLDDMEVRHQMASDVCAAAGVECDHVYSVEQAIKRLEEVKFDAASLDHDLSDEHMQAFLSGSTAADDTTGRAVARWIAEHGRPTIVHAHSFNPPGREAIERILLDSRHPMVVSSAPFGPVSFGHFVGSLQ